MTYYHVTIVQKATGAEEVRLDYRLEGLQQRIVEPYISGWPLTFNGKSITPGDIERVKITKTDLDSSHIRHTLPMNPRARPFATSRGIDKYIAQSGEDVTDEFITGPPGSTLMKQSADETKTQPSTNDREVFVVYGRNDKARDALFTFLRAIDLHPLKLSDAVETTGKTSPYIGETLNAAFSLARAVVVLFTPDDEARLREPFKLEGDSPDEVNLTGQPRQNVLFEAGMAMGLNADRTILVELGSLRQLTDIAGIYVIRMNDTPQRRQELAQRLQTAGCPVDLEGTDWIAAGDFTGALGSTTQGSSETETSAKQHIAETSSSEERRFGEIINASRQLREHISQFQATGHANKTVYEAGNIIIALGALAGQMNALNMNELNERLEENIHISEKLKGISAMLAFLEMHILGRNFEEAKQKFGSYDPRTDNKRGYP